MVVGEEPIAVRVLGRMSRNHIKGADQGTRASGLKSHASKVTDGHSKVHRRSHRFAVCCYGGTTGMRNAGRCLEMCRMNAGHFATAQPRIGSQRCFKRSIKQFCTGNFNRRRMVGTQVLAVRRGFSVVLSSQKGPQR
jgi:hypothetical protein